MTLTHARRRWWPVLVAALAALAVAGLGAITTDLGPWYQSLNQPAWKPPDWAFGPIWTAIFACAAVSGLKAWRAAPDRASRDWLLIGFAFNGFLNVLWSLLFFRLHRPDWSLAEVALLWASVAVLIRMTGRRSHVAAWLLAPYLVWVSLAASINWGVVRLNGPFGG